MKALLLLFVAVLYSCSTGQPQAQDKQAGMKQQQPAANEYIISLNKDIQVEELKNQLSEYGLVVVRDLGRERYLVRFNADPGLDVLKKQDCFKNLKCKIQPNFRYQHY